jgi:hypothetical protein
MNCFPILAPFQDIVRVIFLSFFDAVNSSEGKPPEYKMQYKENCISSGVGGQIQTSHQSTTEHDKDRNLATGVWGNARPDLAGSN